MSDAYRTLTIVGPLFGVPQLVDIDSAGTPLHLVYPPSLPESGIKKLSPRESAEGGGDGA